MTTMIATRFAVATHILLLIATEQDMAAVTSARLADSVNTNPVVVRRICGRLIRAGLIHVRRGRGGAQLARDAAAISLEDVWSAVHEGPQRRLLPIHANPNTGSRVGAHIGDVLSDVFSGAEQALHGQLAQISLNALIDRLPPQRADSSLAEQSVDRVS
jgi:DNA-binding IscR family transcriptional regulator